MKAFKVNKYLNLKLEDGRTNIYVKRELFRQCTILVLNIPVTRISDFNEIQSVDEVSDNQENCIDRSFDRSISIPLDVIFWGHCSNLQAWYEHDYNTRLLHRNLSFPLLKRLTEVGDPLAKGVFKEEIAKRFMSNYRQTREYLLNEGYLDYLNYEELQVILENSNLNIRHLEELSPYIISGQLEKLDRIEMLYFSKAKKISLKVSNITIKFLENFFYYFSKEFPVTFIWSNRSILENFFFPLIKKVSKSKGIIKDFFLEELSNMLKSPTMYNYEILKLFKEIFISGYKKQIDLNNFT